MKTHRKKLRLDVDALEVEAFATADIAAKNGTVYGYSDQSLPCLSDSGTIPCMCLPPLSADVDCPTMEAYPTCEGGMSANGEC